VGLSYAQQVRRWGGRWAPRSGRRAGGRCAAAAAISALRAARALPTPVRAREGAAPAAAPSAAQARASRLRGGHTCGHTGGCPQLLLLRRRPRLLRTAARQGLPGGRRLAGRLGAAQVGPRMTRVAGACSVAQRDGGGSRRSWRMQRPSCSALRAHPPAAGTPHPTAAAARVRRGEGGGRGEQRMLLQCLHDRCLAPCPGHGPEGCGHPAGQGRGGGVAPTPAVTAPSPALRPHLVPRPRVDAGVPEQGLQDGQVALHSRPVKRGAAILQGEERGWRGRGGFTADHGWSPWGAVCEPKALRSGRHRGRR